IYASYSGARASGFVNGSSSNAKIHADNLGANAFGYALDADIHTQGLGASGGGYAKTSDIHAGGRGAFAFGNSSNGLIYAQSDNTVQWGPGTNAQEDSLQVGTTMRLKGTTGVPTGGLHDGDCWVDNSHQYQRSNGISHKVTPRFGFFAKEGSAGTATIGSTKSGVVFGYAALDSSYIKSGTGASHDGTLAGGVAVSTNDGYAAKISAAQGGAVAIGNAKSEYAVGKILASARGSFVFGNAYGDNANSYITASAVGAFAAGYALDGNITASGLGAHASGYASGYNILASGAGSCAFGSSVAEAITASAANAFQFGPGVNAQADSFGVGYNMRLKGTDGAPASDLHDGDIWVANSYVYIRSNGVSCKVANNPL
ncbi:hypothetical protein LCGC14_2041910, partial [marine sediment metagenome]